jgi:hypothetical protein
VARSLVLLLLSGSDHGNLSHEVLKQEGGVDNLMETSPWAERRREGPAVMKNDGGEKTWWEWRERFELQNGGGGGWARCSALL